jgi:hypothetical protein
VLAAYVFSFIYTYNLLATSKMPGTLILRWHEGIYIGQVLGDQRKVKNSHPHFHLILSSIIEFKKKMEFPVVKRRHTIIFWPRTHTCIIYNCICTVSKIEWNDWLIDICFSSCWHSFTLRPPYLWWRAVSLYIRICLAKVGYTVKDETVGHHTNII